MRVFWALLLAMYVVIAFEESSPLQPAFWVILVVGALLAAPNLGYRRREMLTAHAVALLLGVPGGIAFIVSRPGDLAFWIVLVCVFFVTAPGYRVGLMFLRQEAPQPAEAGGEAHGE